MVSPFALVCPSSTEFHHSADQNAFRAPSAHLIELVEIRNVLIHVLVFVVETLNADPSIINLFVLASIISLEIHSRIVIQYQLQNVSFSPPSKSVILFMQAMFLKLYCGSACR